MTNCFLAGGKSFPCNDIAMILLWVSSMVVGIDIDARVYMGESSRSRNFRIKSYEKPYSSRAALAALQAAPQRFDLVITDQTMPHMTGEVLTLALRHIRPDISIILCTGFSHTMTVEKAGVLGIDAFLMKPLVIHDLGLAIQHVLASHRTSL
jgi:DNA-binding NarL/FixJ family response regulator